MRIVHVIPAMSRHYGGGPGVVSALAREQAKRGHDVVILTTDADTPGARAPAGASQDGAVRVVRVRNLSNRLAYGQKVFLAPGFGKAALDAGKADVLHLHDYRTFQNLAAARAARKEGAPFVLQAHGALNTAAKAASKRAFDALAGRRLLRQAARCLALNETEADAYAAMGVERARVALIANGIDEATARDPPGAPGALRARLGLDAETPLALYTGRLHPTKSVDLLVEAFAAIAPRTSAHLAILGGDDGDEQRLKALAHERGLDARVHFLGFVDEAMKWSAYRDADAVIVPSFFGFPLVMLEAWAAARPVVTTTRHERLGFLDKTGGVETAGSAEALAGGLLPLLLDRERARALGARGHAAVLESFTWPRVAASLETLYAEVTA